MICARHLTIPTLGYTLLLTAASAAEPKTVPAARAAYEKADRELNKTYGETRVALGKAALKRLRDSQREWIAHRDYMAERQAAVDGENPGADARDTVGFWNTRSDITDSRIEFLRALVGKGVPPGISGHYQDSYGGSMDLIADGEKLLFQITVVRGPTFHLGDIAGTAKLKRSSAEFSDGGKDHDDGKPTVLRFEFTGTQVDLTGENTGMYHGARAYFDGWFLKYRALSAKEAAALRSTPAGP